jgi:hypothetical protein
MLIMSRNSSTRQVFSFHFSFLFFGLLFGLSSTPTVVVEACGETVSTRPLEVVSIVSAVTSVACLATWGGLFVSYQPVRSTSNWTCPIGMDQSLCCSDQTYISNGKIHQDCEPCDIQSGSECVTTNCTANCAYVSSSQSTTIVRESSALINLSYAFLGIGGFFALATIGFCAELKSRRPNR